MNRSDKIEQVTASLFAVHRDLKNPSKDAKGQVRGRTDYRYLSLPALTEYLRPILKEYQLFVTQELRGGAGFVEVFTTVWHLSGQYLEFGPTFMPSPGDAQQVGSASTYVRRYALSAVFNLAADEDDDAQSTSRGDHALPKDQSPPAPTVGPEPESQGEGDGGSGPATRIILGSEQQWANLLAMVDGKVAEATGRLNRAAGTHFPSYRQARAEATFEQLVMAIEGGK